MSNENGKSRGIAVVTGGSSGIGAATARALAGDGWHVIVAARRTELIAQVAEEIGGEAVTLDVTDEDSVRHLAETVGTVDLLVNNVGGAKGLDSVEEANIDDWKWMYETNVLGTLRVTKALLPKLAPGAQIVNVGSIAGITPYVGGAGYNAAKFGVAALTGVLRLETLDRPLRVCEINPGRVKKDFSLVRFKGDQARADAVYAGHQNLVAEDIAEAIRWVASLPVHVNIDRLVIKPNDQG